MENYINDGDLTYEYSILQDPKNIVNWLKYIAAKRNDPIGMSYVYERCLVEFPEQWNIWNEYLKIRISYLQGVNVVAYIEEYEKVNNIFMKCLVGCKEVIEAWVMFLKFLLPQGDLKSVRLVLKDALRSLPFQHHYRLWEVLIEYVDKKLLLEKVDEEYVIDSELAELVKRGLFGSVENEEKSEVDIWSSNILVRYAQIADEVDLLLPLLKRTRDDAAIIEVYENRIFCRGRKIQSGNLYELYMTYITALYNMKRTEKLKNIIVECVELCPEQSSQLNLIWARFQIKMGFVDDAVSFLMGELQKTVTTKDFTILYDFTVLIHETIVEVLLEKFNVGDMPDKEKLQNRLNQHMDALEKLLLDHPVLFNDLRLRQNPNNIKNWLERSSLFDGLQNKAAVYEDAIKILDPKKQYTPGEFGRLWSEYALLYVENGDYVTAKSIFDKSLNVPFKFLLDVEIIWSEWIKVESKENGCESALDALRESLEIPKDAFLLRESFEKGSGMPSQCIIFTSLKLWMLLLDLLEICKASNTNYFNEVVSVYENLFMLKVASPRILIDYAHFLQKNEKFRESFSVYERAIEVFPPETKFEFWNIYLAEALRQDLSSEELRDLFESALGLTEYGIDCKPFYLLYSKFENDQGMSKRAVDIVRNGCRLTRSLENKVSLWKTCLFICRKLLGDVSARELYEECIRTLPNARALEFVIDFAKLEESLKDYVRVRGILVFGAKLLHPNRNIALWEYWNEFELTHGNKETYKEMLRLKRELIDTFGNDIEFISSQKGNITFVASNQQNKKLMKSNEIESDA